jgi:dolichyl-phosphate-mannose-protein mannosyltransferase
MATPMNERDASSLETRYAVLLLFGCGLAIRLALAHYSAGLAFDVGLFREWSDRLVERGPSHFYERGYFADYPPGYLYVLFVLGKLSRLLRGEPPSIGVLKLPGIIADLGVAVFAMLLAMRITPRASAGRIPLRVAAAAAILLNPGLVLVSAVWGQVDSVLALLVLAGIYALATGRPSIPRDVCGVALFAIAVATKPQAVLALPVLAIVVVCRLGAPVSGVSAWSNIVGRIVVYVVLATAVVIAMFAPFGVGPSEIPGFYRSAGSVYQFTSLWTFNVWGALGFYRPDVGSRAVTLGGVPAYYLGLAAFAGATILLMVRAWRSYARGTEPSAVAVFGVVAVTCAAFALLTRMHERYLYLAVAVLAPLVGYRPFRSALAIMSGFFFLNVHFVYVLFAGPSAKGHAWTIQPVYNALFGVAKDAWQRKAFSVATTMACLALATLGWKWLDLHNGTSEPGAPISDAQM